MGGGGDGEIGLARPRRADAQGQVMPQNPLHVPLLPLGLGFDGGAFGVDVDLVGGPLALRVRRPTDRLTDVLDAEPVLAA